MYVCLQLSISLRKDKFLSNKAAPRDTQLRQRPTGDQMSQRGSDFYCLLTSHFRDEFISSLKTGRRSNATAFPASFITTLEYLSACVSFLFSPFIAIPLFATSKFSARSLRRAIREKRYGAIISSAVPILGDSLSLFIYIS